MSPSAEEHLREVRAYYTEVWLSRFVEGHNAASLAMHFGVCHSPDVDAQEAKRATNEVVHEHLAHVHGRAARVADLGCGMGGTSIHLAEREPGWQLLGVNMAEDQLAFATAAAAKSPARDRVRFVQADYAALPFADATLDAAIFLESACHALDRVALLREVARVLVPGGRVVVVDFARTGKALETAEEREAYAAVCRGFCIPDYFDVPIADCAASVGLRIACHLDLSHLVAPSVARSSRRVAAAPPSPGRWDAHLATLRAIAMLLRSEHLAYLAIVAERTQTLPEARPASM